MTSRMSYAYLFLCLVIKAFSRYRYPSPFKALIIKIQGRMHDIQKKVPISLTNCCLKKKVLIFKLGESLYVDRAPTL